MQAVKKAVIPAAGLGTRVLPATKAMPKGMLPIVDKPAIQYLVEEAVRSRTTSTAAPSWRQSCPPPARKSCWKSASASQTSPTSTSSGRGRPSASAMR